MRYLLGIFVCLFYASIGHSAVNVYSKPATQVQNSYNLGLFPTQNLFAKNSMHKDQPNSKIDERKKMSKASYIIGGILGTWPGFGIGHAVQGRWLEKGWIFTVGEVGAGFFILATMGPGSNLGPVAAAAFMGLRVWQIVDVWGVPHWDKLIAEEGFKIKLIAPRYKERNFAALSFEFIW